MSQQVPFIRQAGKGELCEVCTFLSRESSTAAANSCEIRKCVFTTQITIMKIEGRFIDLNVSAGEFD